MRNLLFFASFIMATLLASAGIAFPELPASNKKEPLTIQLATSTPQVTFRRPATFYVRLINCDNMPMELPMRPTGDNLNINSCVWWYHSKPGTEELLSHGNPFFRGREQILILPAKGILVIKLPEKLLPLGRHEISISYMFNGQEIRSNAVTVSVVEKPLLDNERTLTIQESLKLMLLFRLDNYGNDQWIKKTVENKVTIGGSYLVPELKALMTFPKGRIPAIEILGMIADKERAARIGYIRDTSAADLVIERIDKESDAAVKTALLKIIGKFFDVLTPPQKEKLEKSVLTQLSHADAGVRTQAALTLLELFPKQRGAVETALGKADFADEAGRKAIAETLAKALKP